MGTTTGVASGAANSAESIRKFDWLLLFGPLSLILVGLMSLYSIGYSIGSQALFQRQLLLISFGLVPFAVFWIVSPRFWIRAATPLYILNVIVLAVVLAFGSRAGGAQRWIDIGPIQFQPSEMAKLFTVLTLSSFFLNRLDRINEFSTFALSFIHVLVPLILVYKQPHLGASLVMLSIWFSICVIAGVPWKFTVGSVLCASLFLGIAFFTPGLMKDYQKGRVLAMFQNDVKGSGYQTSRAQIAFGVGNLFGTGYLKGEQKRGKFIPEQHNDFVFTVIGEEGGLVGCSLVLGAFAFFFYRVWLVIFESRDPFFKMASAGVFGMLAFHMVVNLGMILQMLPVVGLWLPFISYGGTAIWLCMACVGLLLSIRRSERPMMF